MSTMTMLDLGTAPRVNLLPPEIQEDARFRRVQLGLALVVVAAVAGSYLLYQQGGSAVTSAQSQLASSQAKSAALTRQLNGLQYVTVAATQKDAAEATLTQALATEVHWSSYMADLSTLVPPTVWMTQISFTESVLPGTQATPPSSGVVGQVSFTGNALGHQRLADWLDAQTHEPGFANPAFSLSTEQLIGSTKVAQFNSNVAITSDGLTKRCAQAGVC